MPATSRTYNWFHDGRQRHESARGPRPAIALNRTLLCLACEAVYEMGNGPCPACGSNAGWSLGRLLARRTA
jgi:hypothetical protein